MSVELETKGKLPKAKVNVEGALSIIGDLLVRSVQKNFERGGRPTPWAKNVGGGETPLVASGALYRSVRKRMESKAVVVQAGEGLGVYPFVHQFGANIDVTKKMRGFFWYMFRLTKREFWKYMALMKKDVIHIPPRPYMLFQAEDIEVIKKILGDMAFEVSVTEGELAERPPIYGVDFFGPISTSVQ